MLKFFEKLKLRMNITSNKQFWTIMLVFALTGTSFLFVKKPIYSVIGITENTPGYLRFILWFLFVLPCYYVLLLFYGTLLGQFTFFWNMVKKSLGRIPKLFKAKTAN
jgi:hypothetical protein